MNMNHNHTMHGMHGNNMTMNHSIHDMNGEHNMHSEHDSHHHNHYSYELTDQYTIDNGIALTLIFIGLILFCRIIYVLCDSRKSNKKSKISRNFIVIFVVALISYIGTLTTNVITIFEDIMFGHRHDHIRASLPLMISFYLCLISMVYVTLYLRIVQCFSSTPTLAPNWITKTVLIGSGLATLGLGVTTAILLILPGNNFLFESRILALVSILSYTVLSISMVYIFVSKLNKYIGLTEFSQDALKNQSRIIRCKLIKVSVKYVNLAFIAFSTTILSLIIHVLSGFYEDVHVHAFDTSMILDTVANMCCLYLQFNFYGVKSKKREDYYIFCYYCDRCCLKSFTQLASIDISIMDQENSEMITKSKSNVPSNTPATNKSFERDTITAKSNDYHSDSTVELL